MFAFWQGQGDFSSSDEAVDTEDEEDESENSCDEDDEQEPKAKAEADGEPAEEAEPTAAVVSDSLHKQTASDDEWTTVSRKRNPVKGKKLP